MEPLDDLREHLAATRSQLKSARNILRATLQMVAELEERINQLPQPDKGAQGNDRYNHRRHATVW